MGKVRMAERVWRDYLFKLSKKKKNPHCKKHIIWSSLWNRTIILDNVSRKLRVWLFPPVVFSGNSACAIIKKKMEREGEYRKRDNNKKRKEVKWEDIWGLWHRNFISNRIQIEWIQMFGECGFTLVVLPVQCDLQ